MKFILEIDTDNGTNTRGGYGGKYSPHKCPCWHEEYLDGFDEDPDYVCQITGNSCGGELDYGDAVKDECPLKEVKDA